MQEDVQKKIVSDIRQYITDNLPLNKLSDEELEERVEGLVSDKLQNVYCTIEERIEIARQIYSSIRGFGLLDSIISDDNITEVMINGADNIFIEKNGRVEKMNKQFESERRLEDVIQRIVGLAAMAMVDRWK